MAFEPRTSRTRRNCSTNRATTATTSLNQFRPFPWSFPRPFLNCISQGGLCLFPGSLCGLLLEVERARARARWPGTIVRLEINQVLAQTQNFLTWRSFLRAHKLYQCKIFAIYLIDTLGNLIQALQIASVRLDAKLTEACIQLRLGSGSKKSPPARVQLESDFKSLGLA